jgi:hypothetical protein
MTIENDVDTVLSGLGTVYPLSMPDQNASLPCTVYQFISAAPFRSHSSKILSRRRLQISCWATTYAAAITLSESVKAAFDLNQTNFKLATHEDERDGKEVETGLSRKILQFYVWAD